jgi:hypothetical protein
MPASGDTATIVLADAEESKCAIIGTSRLTSLRTGHRKREFGYRAR